MTKIVQKENPVLRKVASFVPVKKIPSPEIQRIIATMKKALSSEPDGVAIAAPQIGQSVRIFVIAGKALAINKGEKPDEIHYDDIVCINPKIIKTSKTMKSLDEGCLSVRWIYGSVKRYTQTTIEAYDENGQKFTRGGGGLLSQIFQHEIDHLNGILFTDTAKDLQKIKPENEKR